VSNTGKWLQRGTYLVHLNCVVGMSVDPNGPQRAATDYNGPQWVRVRVTT